MKKIFFLICCSITLQAHAKPESKIHRIRGTVDKYVEFIMEKFNDKKCRQGSPDYPQVTGLPEGVFRSGCNIYGKPKEPGTFRLSFPVEGGEWEADLVISGGRPKRIKKPNPNLDNSNALLPATVTSITKSASKSGSQVTNITHQPPIEYKPTAVRKSIPDTPALDDIYPPMSANSGPRWKYIKTQYNKWYYKQAPSYNKGIRGAANGEAWRYDPMKTLIELCRRAELVGDEIPGVCVDAKETIAEFFSRQYWGRKGEYPDCSGGITGITRGSKLVNKCDFKYSGHASALHYATELYGQTPYTNKQKQMLKEFCFKMGWNGQSFTERNWGISLQCLIDLQKQGVDTNAERKNLLKRLYILVATEKIGAPIHGMNKHEGTSFSPDPQMFSPWMGSSFLIPALWEYWVFIEKDPRIAKLIVRYGDAMLNYGIVDPKKWAPRERWHWKTKQNPTRWLTLYYSIPNDKPFNIVRQNSDGGFSDLHNPESIFALNAAYFFSCNESFKQRSKSMNAYFNNASAANNKSKVNRVFLWQHRGSASTEWLLENAHCEKK